MNFLCDGYDSTPGGLWRREVVFPPSGASDKVMARVALYRAGDGHLVRVEYPSPKSRHAHPSRPSPP